LFMRKDAGIRLLASSSILIFNLISGGMAVLFYRAGGSQGLLR
jgi:hypothetical protein